MAQFEEDKIQKDISDLDAELSELQKRLKLISPEHIIEPPKSSVQLPKELESQIQNEIFTPVRKIQKWDKYDFIWVGLAGTVAALVDFLIVRIPKDVNYLFKFSQKGSPLTKLFHRIDIPTDNALGRLCKASFDEVESVANKIKGFSPSTHRWQTFAHDPLMGLVFGIIDIMRGGLTAVGTNGKVAVISGLNAPVLNPIKAVLIWIGHLLSDVGTKMGIPAPGFSLLQMVSVGKFGRKDRTVAEIARYMYLNGYDFRHFLTMGTSVATVEIILGLYVLLLEYRQGKTTPKMKERIKRYFELRKGAKFISMLFWAHTIAAAANAGKVILYHGNPLAINYVQWIAAFRYLVPYIRTLIRDTRAEQYKRNRKVIDTVWEELSDEDITGLVSLPAELDYGRCKMIEISRDV